MQSRTTSTATVDADKGLAALIDPVGVEAFVGEYLGKQPLLIHGDAHRFASLFSWSLLNEVLASTRFDMHRMRVKGSDGLLNASRYIEPAPQIAPRGNPYRFSAEKLPRVLSDEGTLVIDCFDYYHAPLRRLTGLLEESFHSVTQVNLYMNQTNIRAQSILHWDDHEVFVVQAEGHKKWTLYPSTAPHPVHGLSEPSEPAADGESWSGVLSKGDMLYVPRGWWHQVHASEGPSVHLSFSTRLPSGVSLLDRFVKHLVSTHPAIRRDLPLFGQGSEQDKWLGEFRDAVVTTLDDPVLLRHLIDAERRTPQERPSFSFSSE
ncbi:JmjC domain-containing protein [Streptomyces sp. NPDC001714]|uniref:JmjC domain-containing protein n=1 Tax=Streptomyces sp. NPDC001714 TaxID=3364603 RepID=UPI0036C1D6D8